METNIKVTALNIYPVKSLAGIQLDSSELDSMGLLYDRRWMIVSPEGKFITQRTHPKMALIKTAIEEGQLTLSKEGMDDHLVPKAGINSEVIEVTIWRDTLRVLRVSDATDSWISEALGTPCHLVYISDKVMRQCNLDYANKGDQTGFADAYPLLLLSEASLQDLNARMDETVDMRRFRPNIVIAGCEPYAEDKMTSFTISNIPMRGVKLCDRCTVPTVDPDTGERASKEPIATLLTYRKWDNQVFFGMNVIHEKSGNIKVGDQLALNPSTALSPSTALNSLKEV